MRTVPNKGDLAGAAGSIFPSLLAVVRFAAVELAVELSVERASDILLIGRKNVVFEDASLETGHERTVIVIVLVIMENTVLVHGIVIGVKPHFQTVLDVFQDNDMYAIRIVGCIEVAGDARDVSEAVPNNVLLDSIPFGQGAFVNMLPVSEPDFKGGPEGIGLHFLWRI
jgi:hypothetical protein